MVSGDISGPKIESSGYDIHEVRNTPTKML